MEQPSDMHEAICQLMGKLDSARLLISEVEDELVVIRSRHSDLEIRSWHERHGDESSTLEP
jgi:hypothetical protein